jgi:hypothetical protein
MNRFNNFQQIVDKINIGQCLFCGASFIDEPELLTDADFGPQTSIKHDSCTHSFGMHLECAKVCIKGELDDFHVPKCSCPVIYDGKLYPCDLALTLETLKELGLDDFYLSRYTQICSRSNEPMDFIKERMADLGIVEGIRDFCFCPRCFQEIKRSGGCYRMNCPTCRYSFWMPTGESWEAVATKKREIYDDSVQWWNHPEASEWTCYWRKWIE